MIIPADDRGVDLDLHARLAHLAEHVGPIDLHPDVVAERPQLDQLEDHVRVGAEVQLDLVADRDVFDGLAAVR